MEDLDQYSSMQKFRKAASHRLTFKKALRMMYAIFKKEAEEYDENEEVNDENNANLPRHRERQRRVRFQNNVIPENMDFAPEKIYHTPLKAKKKQMQRGDVCFKVLDRAKKCTGFPCEMICQNEGSNKKDPRRQCYVCKAKTKWQCINCKFYFCMASKKNSNRDAHFYYIKEKENANSNSETTRIYGRSCFHVFHEEAIRDALN